MPLSVTDWGSTPTGEGGGGCLAAPWLVLLAVHVSAKHPSCFSRSPLARCSRGPLCLPEIAGAHGLLSTALESSTLLPGILIPNEARGPLAAFAALPASES
ncbi:hypothetical protein DFH06DRAFT_1241353 [Mycena polygramma]|nr:hypothetical protein DFH06DRAFT_1241353 [Mycena polygramma]